MNSTIFAVMINTLSYSLQKNDNRLTTANGYYYYVLEPGSET